MIEQAIEGAKEIVVVIATAIAATGMLASGSDDEEMEE